MKRKIKYVLISKILAIFLMILFSINCFAQVRGEKQKFRDNMRQKIEAQKVAFITNKLDLTPEEAQSFWPLYNEYEIKRKSIQKELVDGPPPPTEKIWQMSDKEAEQMIQDHFVKGQAMLDFKIEFYEKIKNVISVKKILILFEAEKEFKRILFEKIEEHRNPRKNPRKEGW
ncbi:MAG: hypothetical protein JEY97_08340 [Bacteroidales bacterium]|nr:hypothetical protein [Bacteroidales bacterium]